QTQRRRFTHPHYPALAKIAGARGTFGWEARKDRNGKTWPPDSAGARRGRTSFMRLAETDIDATGREQKQFYRVGGIAALVLAVGYVAIFPLYAKVGAPPSGG